MALEKVADGKATKIIIPSEIQNLAGLVTSLKRGRSGTGITGNGDRNRRNRSDRKQ